MNYSYHDALMKSWAHSYLSKILNLYYHYSRVRLVVLVTKMHRI